jgi:3',5'-cyclic AMP phosphodiesterase CpdA
MLQSLLGKLSFILLALLGMMFCNTVDTNTDTEELEAVSALTGAPFIFAPTKTSFEMSVVAADGDAKTMKLFVKRSADQGWSEIKTVRYPASGSVEWSVSNLSPGKLYPYAIVTNLDALNGIDTLTNGHTHSGLLFSGETVTQREPGESFRVALITDTHIGSNLEYSNQGNPEILKNVGEQIKNYRPDFIVNLGDVTDFHLYGFEPPPVEDALHAAYMNYRTLLGDALGFASHFQVIGNWDGENGWFTEDEIASSRKQRYLCMPGPSDNTYTQGGSKEGDYYAYTWGDALFIVLNVQSYTTKILSLSGANGNPDDWTLGEEQLDWLEKTLKNSSSKWRFILAHHTVGGAAGSESNSIYGRGGGLAAKVGEQATIHQMMIDYGVSIFFYGHDHVFTDMVVDNIHYTLPGSAGAPWLFTTSETGYEKYWGESGWAKLDVSPGSVHVQFINIDGGVIYDFTL